MDLDGSEQMKKQMAAAGLKVPLNINNTSTQVVKLETGAKTASGLMMFTQTFVSNESEMILNGRKQPEPPNRGIEDNVIVTGVIDGQNIRATDFQADNAPPEFIEGMKKMVNQMLKSVEFPSEELERGDTFIIDTPFDLPVPGAAQIKSFVRTTYTLDDFDEAKAHFSIEQQILVGGQEGQASMKIKGDGSGIAVFDRNINMITESETITNFTMARRTENIISLLTFI